MKKSLFLLTLLSAASSYLFAQCTAPTPSITASGPTSFCKGESVDLSIAGNNGMSFDGIDDYVDCGNDASVQLSGTAITLEAWIYPTAWKPNVWQGNIINKELDGPNEGYMLRAGASGQLNFNFGGGDAWADLTSAPGALVLNEWQHVAGTYDGSVLRMYVNGVEIASMPWTGSLSSSSTNLCIGNWGLGLLWGTERHFQGRIDEARVWNVTRSSTEINDNMYSTLAGDTPGLVAYYTFDAGAGETVTDESVNDNTGAVLEGAAWENPGTSPMAPVDIASYLWWPGGQTTSTITVNKTYYYAVTITDAMGCTATSEPFYVHVNKPPYAHITPGGPLTFCAGGSVALVANEGTGLTYQWVKDGVDIGGATDVVYTATEEGEYRCRITKSGTGCSKLSNKANVSVPCREGDMIADGSVSIYPNPAHGVLHVVFDQAQSGSLQIMNTLGALIFEANKSSAYMDISLDNWTPGMYYVRIEGEAGVAVQQVVVQ